MVSAAPQGGINVHLPYIGSRDMIGFKRESSLVTVRGKLSSVEKRLVASKISSLGIL